MATTSRPVFTESFSANLGAIEHFLGADGRGRFRRLMVRLLEDVVGILCRFPRSGRSFLDRIPHSTEAAALRDRLRASLHEGDELREYLFDDYLVLYLVRGDKVVFLSIRHHRQLSFDLSRFWREG